MSNQKNKFSVDDCPEAENLENEEQNNNWADQILTNMLNEWPL